LDPSNYMPSKMLVAFNLYDSKPIASARGPINRICLSIFGIKIPVIETSLGQLIGKF